MTTLKERESIGWQAHAELFRFAADEMRDNGFYVGAPKRVLRLPKSVERAPGWRFAGQVLREPLMDEMLLAGIEPEKVEAGNNLLVTAGITRMLNLLIAAGGQAYDNTHTRILAGDGTGSVPTAAAGDTDLAAAVNASNRYGQMADATYPSVATNVLTVQSTFATGNGNFAWKEWGIDQATASGATAATAPLLNHKGVDLGTKTSAASWAFRITITVS